MRIGIGIVPSRAAEYSVRKHRIKSSLHRVTTKRWPLRDTYREVCHHCAVLALPQTEQSSPERWKRGHNTLMGGTQSGALTKLYGPRYGKGTARCCGVPSMRTKSPVFLARLSCCMSDAAIPLKTRKRATQQGLYSTPTLRPEDSNKPDSFSLPPSPRTKKLAKRSEPIRTLSNEAVRRVLFPRTPRRKPR